MQSLSPGQNTSLPTGSPVAITVKAGSGHVDPIALLLDGARKADGDNGVVLFSNPQAAGGAVSLDVPADVVTVDLAALPAAVETVLIVAQADGTPTVQGNAVVEATITVAGAPAASVRLDSLPAVATLQVAELYRRGGEWKVRALGDGYAEGLAKLLTVHGVDVTDDGGAASDPAGQPAASSGAAAPTPAAPPTSAAPPVNLEKQRLIDLRKKVQDSAPPSLVKSFDSAVVSLEKQGLVGERAEVVLMLDVSGSSRPLFKNGTYQALVERCLAAGLLFDDNGEIETYLFDSAVHEAETVTLANREGWTDRAITTKGIFRGTRYAKPLEVLADKLVRGAKTPTFVYFVTDGGNQDRRETAEIVKRMAGLPAFLKFIAVGREDDFPFLVRLDDLTGREVDNADFFAVADPRTVDENAFFELVMQEFRGWLVEARRLGILGS
ncbi:MAG: VWA domain-containing protein [Solirubrobacteraceae bacterium]|nr:VWA domain-containing protein [Solirubrobacteraceae bacterium]